ASAGDAAGDDHRRAGFFGAGGHVDRVQTLIDHRLRRIHRFRDDVEYAVHWIDDRRTGNAHFRRDIAHTLADQVPGDPRGHGGLTGVGPMVGVDQTHRPE